MEPESNPPEANEAGTSQLLSYDARELEKVSRYSTKKQTQTQKQFDDVSEMGQLRLIWDSKVPQKSKKFYNFVSFSSSNREEILEEIQKYFNFYKELRASVRIVSSTEENPESEKVDPFSMIADLNEHLTQMIEAADLGKSTTDSSIVYKLHRSFITKHEKLEGMIKRVECIAFKEGMRKASAGWQESVRVIEKVTNDWEDAKKTYEDVCKKFEWLMNEHEKLLEKQKK